MSDAAKFDAELTFGQIEERLKGASHGKWKVVGDTDNYKVVTGGDLDVCTCWAGESDAEFIAHAPADIRWLLSRVEDLEDEARDRDEARED